MKGKSGQIIEDGNKRFQKIGSYKNKGKPAEHTKLEKDIYKNENKYKRLGD